MSGVELNSDLHRFSALSAIFQDQFNKRHFPIHPANLYDASQYILGLGGKRLRPVCLLMGNELFSEISENAFHAANAIELFHNFSLIHDDIMDKAPLRRGKATVHTKFGESTALLAGDVMLVASYDNINKIKHPYINKIITLFNQTARQVCEGQQMDLDFENLDSVSFDDYLHMITLKTSVLLAASLQMGAIIGGAGLGNQQNLYEFGKHLGIAFQVQDDYLDAFGEAGKFGKKIGGDILQNKKTFLLIHALLVSSGKHRRELKELLGSDDAGKVEKILEIYRSCNMEQWAGEVKEKYFNIAMQYLEDIAVVSSRKQPLHELATDLMQRDY